jgi:hypothetical protein
VLGELTGQQLCAGRAADRVVADELGQVQPTEESSGLRHVCQVVGAHVVRGDDHDVGTMRRPRSSVVRVSNGFYQCWGGSARSARDGPRIQHRNGARREDADREGRPRHLSGDSPVVHDSPAATPRGAVSWVEREALPRELIILRTIT